MIRAIIIDDEQHCIDMLCILLKEYCPEVQVNKVCSSAKDGIHAIEKYNPDLVFLDIEMPAMNGFDMLEKYVKIPFTVIFITSYDQYAIKAIRFSALDYLLKPVDAKELIAAVHRMHMKRTPPASEQLEILFSRIQHRDSAFRKMALPTNDGYEMINVEQIIRCEADDTYTHFFLKSQKKITVSRTLKEVAEQLQDFPFFVRVHHSWVINMNEVNKYVRGDGGYVIMSDGSCVNVSRTRKEALLKWF